MTPMNLRIFEALACEGFLVSDRVPAAEAEFGEAVVFTSGYEDLWAEFVRYLDDEPDAAVEPASGGKSSSTSTPTRTARRR